MQSCTTWKVERQAQRVLSLLAGIRRPSLPKRETWSDRKAWGAISGTLIPSVHAVPEGAGVPPILGSGSALANPMTDDR
jgi:hypothetical protein